LELTLLLELTLFATLAMSAATTSEVPGCPASSPADRRCGHYLSDEILKRGAYLLRRIFLDEVNTWHLHLSLIWPSSAKFQRAANQNRTRFGGDEQLGQTAFGQPFAIFRNDGDDISGLALDRQLARPYQQRKSRFSIAKWSAVGIHLLLAQLSDNAFLAPSQ
jgi:hypothetical protein